MFGLQMADSVDKSVFEPMRKFEKMSLLVRFFGETPSRHIVTCLLLCAARDLKSSQCAVHVVGPVHCTQRNHRPCVKENDQIL